MITFKFTTKYLTTNIVFVENIANKSNGHNSVLQSILFEKQKRVYLSIDGPLKAHHRNFDVLSAALHNWSQRLDGETKHRLKKMFLILKNIKILKKNIRNKVAFFKN